MEELIIEEVDEILVDKRHSVGKRKRRTGFFLSLFGAGVILLAFSVVFWTDQRGSGRAGSPAAALAGEQTDESTALRYSVPPRGQKDPLSTPKPTTSADTESPPPKLTAPQEPATPFSPNSPTEQPLPILESERHEEASTPPTSGPIGLENGVFANPRKVLPSTKKDPITPYLLEKELSPENLPTLAEESLRGLRPHQSQYTLQLAVYSAPEAALKGLKREKNHSKFIVVPKKLGEKHCLAVLWGLYDTRKEAGIAIGNVPSFFAETGEQPLIVPIKTYFQH